MLLALTERCATYCRVWRQNSGALRDATGRLVRFGLPGAADLTGLMIPTGRRLEIEIKRPGERLRPDQERYRDMVRGMGGLYIVVHSPLEAVVWILNLADAG